MTLDVTRPARPLELLALAGTATLAGMMLFLGMRGLNEAILSRSGAADLRGLLQSHWFDAALLGLALAGLFTAGIVSITMARCPYLLGLRCLGWALAGAGLGWLLGGAASLAVAAAVPSGKWHELLGIELGHPEWRIANAWIGGSQLGIAYFGIAALLGGLLFLQWEWSRDEPLKHLKDAEEE